jgi:hypothetical protein
MSLELTEIQLKRRKKGAVVIAMLVALNVLAACAILAWRL